MLHLLNPIKIIVLLTFLIGLLFLNRKNAIHKKVLLILLICFFNEFVSILLKYNTISIDSLFNFTIIIHNVVWLWVISGLLLQKTKMILLFGYPMFGILNMIFWEGWYEFNYYTFVFGALLYVIVFIFLCFEKLKAEELTFFQSNFFLLLFSPVIFFLGMSFMFCFKSHELTSTLLFWDIKLYKVINYFVNIVYYAFLNWFIFKERRLNHV